MGVHMRIEIIAENEEEEKFLSSKKVGFKGVTDYYLDVRWLENKIVYKSESRSSGDLLYLIGRLYTAIIQLKEHWKGIRK
jgi:hypothetical protein